MDYYELISEAIISGETGKVVKYIIKISLRTYFKIWINKRSKCYI